MDECLDQCVSAMTGLQRSWLLHVCKRYVNEHKGIWALWCNSSQLMVDQSEEDKRHLMCGSILVGPLKYLACLRRKLWFHFSFLCSGDVVQWLFVFHFLSTMRLVSDVQRDEEETAHHAERHCTEMMPTWSRWDCRLLHNRKIMSNPLEICEFALKMLNRFCSCALFYHFKFICTHYLNKSVFCWLQICFIIFFATNC